MTSIHPENPTCYLAGTHILTLLGEVLVENLKIGDLLPTLSGQNVAIKWIGKKQCAGYFVLKDDSPVCFRAGSLGEDLPTRDLSVSAEHAMKIRDYLVDARLLVNGVTITQHRRVEQLEYYQLDLGEHHCIRAEGTWSESYAERSDNRATSETIDELHQSHPDHTALALTKKCLPHLADRSDARLSALFQRLLALVPKDRITTDADLHLLADGRRIAPFNIDFQTYSFKIPTDTKVLRLKSRASSFSELGLSSDTRQLGFCVDSLSSCSRDKTLRVAINLQRAKALQGFHPTEATTGRWTQGEALLPNVLVGDGNEEMILTLTGRQMVRYHLGYTEISEDDFLRRLRPV